MGMLETLLVTATVLCALVAGFLFAFAVVAMPGFRVLDDGAFIRAFQVVDGVIQSNQPLFLVVWAGSIVALLAAAVVGFGSLGGVDLTLLLAATLLYLFGVQLPTAAVNVPLNNGLQAVDVSTSDEAQLRAARARFEPRWNRWNVARTVVATLTAAMLMVLLLRL